MEFLTNQQRMKLRAQRKQERDRSLYSSPMEGGSAEKLTEKHLIASK
jgi:hypothetical protein